jgi:hypothetical protein
MAELTKDQLHEAYALAKAMGNAFRAFKDSEQAMVTLIQGRQELERLGMEIGTLRLEKEQAIAEKSQAEALLGDVRKDLEGEAERLAGYRAEELAKIAQETANAKAAAELEIAALQSDMVLAMKELDVAMKDKNAALLLAAQEIAAKQKVLEGLKAELAAIAAKIGG